MITRLQAEEVRELVYEVGEYIRSERVSFESSAVEHKDTHDMVSYVDKTSEKKLIAGIERISPASSFRAEETGMQSTGSPYQWIIDPLDGTTNFIHNIPHFCISIGLQFNDQLVAGWVYEICTDEMYTAIKGEGAFLNKKKIEVSKTNALHDCLMATGFPVRAYDQLDEYLQLQKWMIENTRGLRRMGTAAYDLCMVASGKVQAYFEPGLSPWDVAGGALIVEEAGGKVSDFAGGEGFMENATILATNTYIHNSILKEIHRCMHI